jgi:ribosome-binding protein aMBF1 (putative translation factor)
VAKQKTPGARRTPSDSASGPKRPARAFVKPRSGGNRRASGRRLDKSEQKYLAKFKEEREQLVRIVASVFRAAREDKDVKQAQMAYFLARGSNAIGNMESQRTDFALADAILWARALDPDPKFLEDTFERLLLSVQQFYKRQRS